MSERAETGPMQFGGDWPGTFIRGDNAAMYAIHLERLLELMGDRTDPEAFYSSAVVRGLLSDLQGSREPVTECQKLRPWSECQPPIPCPGCGHVINGPHACRGR